MDFSTVSRNIPLFIARIYVTWKKKMRVDPFGIQNHTIHLDIEDNYVHYWSHDEIKNTEINVKKVLLVKGLIQALRLSF